MFTGIIEEIGSVLNVRHEANSIRLKIAAKTVLSDVKIGDSISTNGVCLTVVNFDNNSYCADVMPETMNRTNFKSLKINDKVNLERAMSANGRFGGHIVSGHIDGTGIIQKIYRDDKAIRLVITTSPDIIDGIVEKGSIAIDGISLTIAEVGSDWFGVSIIEHTQHQTTLSAKRVGETVNLETDMIGKYLKKFVKKDTKLTLETLLENNF